jgi:hypothetical protein
MKVTGQTYDNDMKWLPSVNIEVVGENSHAISNSYGEFEINAANENSQLKFSFVGYDFDIVTVKDFNKTGFIELYPGNQELPEVSFSSTKKTKDNSMLILLAVLAVGVAIKFGLKKKPLKVKV